MSAEAERLPEGAMPDEMTPWLGRQVRAVSEGYAKAADSGNIMDVANVTIEMEMAWMLAHPVTIARALTLAVSVLALERQGLNVPDIDPLPTGDPEPTDAEVEAFKTAWEAEDGRDTNPFDKQPGTRTRAGLRAALAARFAR